MKYFLILLTALFTLGATEAPAPPNIIFILADDLGYAELGCYGNAFNETPNLDRLAADGVRFTQAYAAAPVCSPYRAALLTGMYPARVGITDYLRPAANDHLDTAYQTLPETLRERGYRTGIIGKWHLSGYVREGAAEETLPDRHGFAEVLSSEVLGIGAGTYFYPYHFNPELAPVTEAQPEYLIDRMNQEAVEFIERNREGPFFLYLSHYGVHTMLHGKPELVDKYRRKAGSGHSGPSNNNPENDPYVKWPADYFASHNNPHLAAQLEVIDAGVGAIRAKLTELGLAENTIIVFTSDNGGELRVTENTPLRGGKSELYEGGIREPLLVYQPGRVEGGRTVRTPTANYDFYPTLCAMAGVAPPATGLDGRNILSAMVAGDTTGEARPFYWHYPLDAPHFLGGFSAGAVRRGDWKLIEHYTDGRRELYNLAEDPGETTNRYGDARAEADALQRLLIDWRSDVLTDDHLPESAATNRR